MKGDKNEMDKKRCLELELLLQCSWLNFHQHISKKYWKD